MIFGLSFPAHQRILTLHKLVCIRPKAYCSFLLAPMRHHYLLLLLIVISGYGQSGGTLRALAEQTVPQPASPRRDSILFKTYSDLSTYYRWGSSQGPANIDSALFFANTALQIAPTKRHRAEALLLRGDAYISTELGFSSAWMGLDDLNQAGNLYLALRDTNGLRQTFGALANLYLIRYNPQDIQWANSLRYAILSMRTQSDPTFRFPNKVEAPANDSPADFPLIREAIRVGEQNRAFWQRQHSKPHEMWRLGFLSKLYRHPDIDPAQGKAYEVRALQLASELQDKAIIFTCLTHLAQWELEDRNYAQSLTYARQGLALATHEKQAFRQAGFHDRLYYTFRAMGQLDSAFRHKEITIAINDSLARLGDRQQIQYLRDKYTAEKRQRELEQELTQQNNLLYLVLGFGLVLLGAVGFFVWRNQSLSRKNDELRVAQLQGQTLERQRVAADLHDNLGTTLSALHWNLEALDTTQLSHSEQAVYSTIRQQVGQAYTDVRLLSHNLLPDELAKQGLAVALKYLVQKMNRNTAVRFSLTGTDTLPRLDPQTEFELYSICLELLNNILKHANATEGHIELALFNTMLHLTVSDNGSGLKEHLSDGRGLQNIAARVTSLGGKWAINSGSGGGLLNQIQVPITTPTHASSHI